MVSKLTCGREGRAGLVPSTGRIRAFHSVSLKIKTSKMINNQYLQSEKTLFFLQKSNVFTHSNAARFFTGAFYYGAILTRGSVISAAPGTVRRVRVGVVAGTSCWNKESKHSV